MKANDWIANNFNKFNNYKDLSIAYNDFLKKDISKDTVRLYANNLGLFYGSGKRIKINHIYNEEEINWLCKHCNEYSDLNELAFNFNDIFKTNLSKDALRTKAQEFRLKFPNGTKKSIRLLNAFNKNRARKIGEIFRKQEGQEYIRVAITDGTIKNDYQLLQQYKYEEYHNKKLQKNETVIFLNGNRYDYSKNNLLKITKAEYAFLSGQGYMKGNSDIILTMLELYRLGKIIKEYEKRQKDETKKKNK